MFRVQSHPWLAYMLFLGLIGLGLAVAFVLLYQGIVSQVPRFGISY